MNKKEFMNIFRNQLKGIPEHNINEILYDYEEHFNIAISEGRTEEEIAKALGNPKQLAKESKANFLVNQVEDSFSIKHFFQALFALVGLGFFNLVIVLGPFIGIAAALFSFIVAGIAIVGSGILVIILSCFPGIVSSLTNIPHPVVGILTGLVLISFGGLWTIGSYYLNRYYYILTIKYLKLNLNLIVNRREKND